MRVAFVVTCEHGGNRIPARYRSLFAGRQDLLASHRGYDLGALEVARALARSLQAPLEFATVSRLLVDLNRSLGHPRAFSAATRGLAAADRADLVARYYAPHRLAVERRVRHLVSLGYRVVHVASHSFTPELDGHVRTADVGLLYDPRRPGEVRLAAQWKAALAQVAPQLRVRRNYPYLGKGDGLTAHLRGTFGRRAYVGIELEFNQQIVLAGAAQFAALRRALVASLRLALAR